MTVVLVAAVVAIPATAVTTPTTAKVIDGRVDDWIGQSSGYGGSTQYSSGEFIYQDHVFDDLGPETRQRGSQHGTTGAPAGDYRYPTEDGVAKSARRYANNAADLQELRFAADETDLFVLARLSTMLDREAAVVAIGLDTDGVHEDDAHEWPYGAGLRAAGVDKVITLWGTGGTITDLDAQPEVSLDLPSVASIDDTADNAIEARIPRALIGTSTVRAWAATGLWTGSEWREVPTGAPTATQPGGGLGGTRAWNAAFRDDPETESYETGSYMEEVQAAALATGDITEFSATVRIDDLVAGVDIPFVVQPGRFYAVVIDTGFAIPPEDGAPSYTWEGVDYVGRPGRFEGVAGRALTQEFEFYGRYQPYGLYIPSAHGQRQLPAALVLHGIGGSHSGYNTQPGFVDDMGEGINGRYDPMYLITPLARGGSFYADWGEADALAALDDAARRVDFDPERLYITGYSMGGYGVYRLTSLYPDRFAAAVAWAGYTGEFTGAYTADAANEALGRPRGTQGRANIGDPIDTLANLRHVPLVHMVGSNDEIVPTTGQLAGPLGLQKLGYRSRVDVYLGYEHFSFALVDDWKRAREWLADHPVRTSRPRVVDYVFSDGWTEPGLAEQLGLTHGNAWWIRDLRMHWTAETPPTAFDLASVRAESHRLEGEVGTGTVELPQSVAVPTPHTEQQVAGAARSPAGENRLSLTLRGIGAMSLDVRGAALDACGIVLDVDTDGPATIRLNHRYLRPVRLAGLPGASIRREPGSFDAIIDIAAATTATGVVLACVGT